MADAPVMDGELSAILLTNSVHVDVIEKFSAAKCTKVALLSHWFDSPDEVKGWVNSVEVTKDDIYLDLLSELLKFIVLFYGIYSRYICRYSSMEYILDIFADTFYMFCPLLVYVLYTQNCLTTFGGVAALSLTTRDIDLKFDYHRY